MSTKHQSVTVQGLCMYCDACGVAGPEVAYENHDDLHGCAEMDGWSVGDGETLKDLCPYCKKRVRSVAAPPKPRKKAP